MLVSYFFFYLDELQLDRILKRWSMNNSASLSSSFSMPVNLSTCAKMQGNSWAPNVLVFTALWRTQFVARQFLIWFLPMRRTSTKLLQLFPWWYFCNCFLRIQCLPRVHADNHLSCNWDLFSVWLITHFRHSNQHTYRRSCCAVLLCFSLLLLQEVRISLALNILPSLFISIFPALPCYLHTMLARS